MLCTSAPQRKRTALPQTDRQTSSQFLHAQLFAHAFLYHAVRDAGSHMAHCNDAPHLDVPAAQGRAPAYASSPGAGRCASATIARTCSRLAASAGCRGCARCCARHASLNVVSPGGRSRMNLRARPRAVEHRGCRHHTLLPFLGRTICTLKHCNYHSTALPPLPGAEWAVISRRGRSAPDVHAATQPQALPQTQCSTPRRRSPMASRPHPSWQLPCDRQAALAA